MIEYVVGAGIGAMSAILANKSVAVFNDGFRPVFTEYFSKKMDRKALAATSFALSIGLVLGYGFVNSIAIGIIIIHTILLMGDIIGTACPETKIGMVVSGALGACWSLIVILFLKGIYAFFKMMPVNFLTPLGDLSNYILATFSLFPAIAVAHQFKVKKGIITAAVISVTYILIKKFGTFKINGAKMTLNAEGMAMLVGTILMIYFAMKSNQKSDETGVADLFAQNTIRIRKKWYLFALSGGFLAAGTSISLITTGIVTGGMMAKGAFGNAALFTVVTAIGYIPLIYTTAICTGVFTPGSNFVLAVGMFVASFGLSQPLTILIAFVGGAVVSSFETVVIGQVGKGMDQFPALRDMGGNIRTSMSEVLNIALLIGAFVATGEMTKLIGMVSLGPVILMAVWLLNKHAKKPILTPLAVGPVVTVLMGILVNIMAVCGLRIA